VLIGGGAELEIAWAAARPTKAQIIISADFIMMMQEVGGDCEASEIDERHLERAFIVPLRLQTAPAQTQYTLPTEIAAEEGIVPGSRDSTGSRSLH
jgi:hypothetical protein